MDEKPHDAHEPAQTFLYSGLFDDHWEERCLQAIRSHCSSSGTLPLVLLPDDIQQDEYSPHFELLHGRAGIAALAALLEGEVDAAGRLIFVDLAPGALPGDDMVSLLLRHLDLPRDGLTLVVAAPDPTPFPPGLFGRHFRFPAFRGRR